MTRSEFDQQVRELKNKRGNAIREIAALQSEIKEEIAAKHRQIDDIRKDISKLQASLQGYHQRRIALETEWNAKVNAFIKEHEPSTSLTITRVTICKSNSISSRTTRMNSIYDTPEYKERWAMYQSALDAGIPIVSTETCAIICAMLLVWGNTAEFTHNHRLVCELQYAQKRFGIEGGSVPNDRNFLTALNYYTDLLTLNQQREDRVPDHIDAMFQERYGYHFNRD